MKFVLDIPEMELPEMKQAVTEVKHDESCELKMYLDTKKINTIGWGFNLDANKIPQEVADYLLYYMMREALKDAKEFCGAGWDKMNEARRAVMINLAYNVGRKTLFSFTTLRTGIQQGNFDYAAARLLSYKWCGDVKTRCPKMVRQLKTGEVQ